MSQKNVFLPLLSSPHLLLLWIRSAMGTNHNTIALAMQMTPIRKPTGRHVRRVAGVVRPYHTITIPPRLNTCIITDCKKNYQCLCWTSFIFFFNWWHPVRKWGQWEERNSWRKLDFLAPHVVQQGLAVGCIGFCVSSHMNGCIHVLVHSLNTRVWYVSDSFMFALGEKKR